MDSDGSTRGRVKVRGGLVDLNVREIKAAEPMPHFFNVFPIFCCCMCVRFSLRGGVVDEGAKFFGGSSLEAIGNFRLDGAFE